MEDTKGLDIRFFSKEIDVIELPSAYNNATEVRDKMEYFGLGEVIDEVILDVIIMVWTRKISHRERRRECILPSLLV